MDDKHKKLIELTIKQNRLAEKLAEEPGGFLNKTLMIELLKIGEEIKTLLAVVELE